MSDKLLVDTVYKIIIKDKNITLPEIKAILDKNKIEYNKSFLIGHIGGMKSALDIKYRR